MEFECMEIHRAASYETNAGQLVGHIKFKSPRGEVKIPLHDELAAKIMSLCAQGVVDAAGEAAQIMVADVITSQPALVNKQAS